MIFMQNYASSADSRITSLHLPLIRCLQMTEVKTLKIDFDTVKKKDVGRVNWLVLPYHPVWNMAGFRRRLDAFLHDVHWNGVFRFSGNLNGPIPIKVAGKNRMMHAYRQITLMGR